MRDGQRIHMVQQGVMTVARVVEGCCPRMFSSGRILNQRMVILQGVQRIVVKSLMLAR
jgi:hypothetical protein